MARPRSDRVNEIKARLQTRLSQGVHRAGDRFLSTREIAAAFQISYQTAHRIVQELTAEGLLERWAGSGTYIPGGETVLEGAQLLFNARGKRAGSFGARLLEDLARRLERDGVEAKVSWWTAGEVKLSRRHFPVMWECAPAVEGCVRARRAGLLLNDRPQPGLSAAYLDSISIDDFSGGVCAAELLGGVNGGENGRRARAKLAVLSGPAGDARSDERRDGFLSLIPNAAVVPAGSWFFEDGYRVAGEAVRLGRDGLFCCNDRLAEAVIAHCRDRPIKPPRLVGFDDAPVAEQLNLTTIAIPWAEMIAGAADLIKQHLGGGLTASRQLIFTPRPVVRKL
jgi:hypothetical protein